MAGLRRCVVVPTDFSEASLAALDEARTLVENDSDVHLVHVLAVLHPMDPAVMWHAAEDRDRMKSVKAAMTLRLAEHHMPGVQIHARVGGAAEEVATLATELKADLVVVASRGHTGITRLLLGSVAERIARAAPCSVLIVRRPDA